MPESLLHAPKKGYGTPFREWFKGKRFIKKLENNLKHTKEIFNAMVVEKIIKGNNSGERDNGNILWGLMMLNKALK